MTVRVHFALRNEVAERLAERAVALGVSRNALVQALIMGADSQGDGIGTPHTGQPWREGTVGRAPQPEPRGGAFDKDVQAGKAKR